MRLIRRSGRNCKPEFCVEVREGLCRDLPTWMFDASLCAAMVRGRPQICPTALKEIRGILDGLQSDSTGSWKCLQKEGTFDDITGQNRSDATSTSAGDSEGISTSARTNTPGRQSKHWGQKQSSQTEQRRSRMNPKITPEHLGRGAVVYVRQSTLGQVVENTESQRR